VLIGLTAALAAAVVFGASAICQALGSRKVSATGTLGLRLASALLRQPAFLAALVLNLLGFVLHLVAVRTLPLFLAQAGIAASLVVTAVLAVRIFHDRLTRFEWAAVAAVCAGLVALTAAAGSTGEQRATSAAAVGAYAVAGALALLGLLASRSRSTAAGAVLSVLAGVGFAATALVARLLPDLGLALLTEPITAALPACGALAFLLYSLALQRSSVTVATAPMIVVQTALPAVVGVVVLGDEIRSGWGLVATASGVITLAAATVLVRFEGARDHTT